MNNKRNDTLTERTRTRLHETLEFKLTKQMVTFSFNPQINLAEEGNWSLAKTSFGTMNSVFNLTSKNNSFSITTPGHCYPRESAETINKLQKILEPTS